LPALMLGLAAAAAGAPGLGVVSVDAFALVASLAPARAGATDTIRNKQQQIDGFNFSCLNFSMIDLSSFAGAVSFTVQSKTCGVLSSCNRVRVLGAIIPVWDESVHPSLLSQT